MFFFFNEINSKNVFKNAVLMSMDKIAKRNAVIIVTTTKFVTSSLETAADALMVIKMQNVMKVSYYMYHFIIRERLQKTKS